MSTYSIGDAARILKVNPARLRYWERTELVQPRGDDTQRAPFEFRDLVCVRGILALLEQGVPLRRIRRNVEILRDRLPEIDDPIRELRVWVEGSERMVVRHDGILLEPDGQMVLDFGTASETARSVTPLDRVDDAQVAAQAEALFVEGCALDGDASTFARAVDAYTRALEIDPDFADCHCNLGAVHYNRGERKAATACFERCLEIEPEHVEANFNLANLMEEEGRDQVALRLYRVALAADPLYPDLHINLALLYEKLGLDSQARSHWHRYLRLDATGAWADVARRRLARKD